MFGNCNCTAKLELNDDRVLFPESYEEDDRDTLLAKLRDRDRVIMALWFEVKEYRELEKESGLR